MIIKNQKYYWKIICLLVCLTHTGVGCVYAQEAAARRKRLSINEVSETDIRRNDSIAISDSLALANQRNIKKLSSPVLLADSLKNDSVNFAKNKKQWIPNSGKATWLAVIFPGGGQIYNKKYWKLPIIYGGFAGCAYALSWNNKMYKDYSQAYMDLMDDNENTNSYLDLLPPNANYTDSQLQSVLKKRKDMNRRYRDMSIFAFIGVYLVSIIDAYVDAELSSFDITPDLSMKVEPTIINNRTQAGKSVGLQCSFRF